MNQPYMKQPDEFDWDDKERNKKKDWDNELNNRNNNEDWNSEEWTNPDYQENVAEYNKVRVSEGKLDKVLETGGKIIDAGLKVEETAANVVGILTGLSFAGLGLFMLFVAWNPNINVTMADTGEPPTFGGRLAFSLIPLVFLVIGGFVALRGFGVLDSTKERRRKKELAGLRKVKIKYTDGKVSIPFVAFGLCFAVGGIFMFVTAFTEKIVILFFCGIPFFLVGAVIVKTACGIGSNKKSPKKRLQLFRENGKAVRAYITSIEHRIDSETGKPYMDSCYVICQAENGGLKYKSDMVMNSLEQYVGRPVWVYLDPDDDSEYGAYSVDLQEMANSNMW